MATAFLMPKLGLTMEAGTITEWLVEDGASVTKGMAVLSIETDKVETEVESSGDGLLHQAGRVGDTFDCGETIGWFLADGEEAPAPAEVEVAAPTPVVTKRISVHTSVEVGRADDRLFASPNARRIAAERGIDVGRITGSGPHGRIVSEDVLASNALASTALASNVLASTAPATGGAASATFAARQLAELLGIDIATVSPSGVDPRIERSDVARHVRRLLATPTPEPMPKSVLPLLQTPTSVIPMRGMRATIAERMHTSLQQMAQLTLSMNVAMDAVIADREGRKAHGAVPGYTDYVIAAAAAALKSHPVVNSQITEDGVALLPAVNVGMAVAVDGGLVVPVVPNTDQLSLPELSAETTRLADAARSGQLQLAELEGGTFSVTALGMFGVDMFTPVINPPNTAILGVGRLRDEVSWIDDAPVRTSVLTLSLTWDHRAFDGAPAAEFAAAIKTNLESPVPTS